MITLTNSENVTLDIGDGDGGQYFLDVKGTFPSSGNIKLHISVDGGTSYSVLTTAIGTELSVTANYNAVVTLAGKSKVKVVADSMSTPGATIQLVKVL